MLYLLFTICCTAVLAIIFKLYERFKVDTLSAIVVNYFTAAGLGFALMPSSEGLEAAFFTLKPWVVVSIILGLLFIGIFYIMALSAQKVGVAITAIANSMSTIIPTLAAVVLYNEALPALKTAGILLALIGLYFATKQAGNSSFQKKYLIFPAILFFGSGINASLINYTQVHFFDDLALQAFTPTIFGIAALAGLVWLLFRKIKTGQGTNGKSILWGIILGIPNYGSIFFLVLALEHSGLESSQLFPVNYMSVVILSALLALWIFKEKVSKINWLGILTCVVSIALIAFHQKILAFFDL